jgi:hypothetical protein
VVEGIFIVSRNCLGMEMNVIDNFFKKILVVGFILVPVIILFLWWRAGERVEKVYNANCKLEKRLKFEGIVSDYKTDIFAEKSSFRLNDSTLVTIPRSSKQVSLHNGDTVIKLLNQNSYVVKWANKFRIGHNGSFYKAADTFIFECPEID